MLPSARTSRELRRIEATLLDGDPHYVHRIEAIVRTMLPPATVPPDDRISDRRGGSPVRMGYRRPRRQEEPARDAPSRSALRAWLVETAAMLVALLLTAYLAARHRVGHSRVGRWVDRGADRRPRSGQRPGMSRTDPR